MFNFDYNKPGPSRQPFYNNESFYDYPPRNSHPTVLSAAERLRESHRGARQSYNTNYQSQNKNMNVYPSTQWAPAGGQFSSRRPPNPGPTHQKDKKRDNNYNKDRDNKGQRSQHAQQQFVHSKKNKNNASHGDDKSGTILHSKEIDYRLYKCSNCSLQFDCSMRFNSYIGRIPLILNCKHTVCQECIHNLSKDGSVLCPVCKKPSVLPPKTTLEDLQDIFSPNFFLIGFIMWCKSQGNNPNFMSLVPVQPTLSGKKATTEAGINSAAAQQSGEICCFLSCSKPATLQCQDCSDVYCANCCTNVHKSAKSLWSHKQVPLVVNKNSLELDKCPEHSMSVEYFCTTCKVEVCCYCFIEQHESHGKENLSRLSDEEMQELQVNKENARKILKRLLISQRRLKDLYSCSTTNIEKKVSNYFVNYHARLQFIEKTLKKEISSYSSDGKVLPDVDNLNSKLASSIETLTNVVVGSDALEHRKMNVKELSQRLKDVQNIPCYLLTDTGNKLEPLEFNVDAIADSLEEFFKIEKNVSCDFRLVSEDDLPSDYEKESIEQQYESDAESCISSLSKNVVPEENKSKKKSVSKSSPGSQVPLDNEMVEVTHIESLECFYVQLKRMQNQFSAMNRDINDYIKMGAPTVEHPQLNELYLVMYQTKTERIWCRGRITELKNGETEPLYEVFFIDYGSTQTVDDLKLRQITASLANKKPFAIHCELYNPSMATWGKNAHLYMAKMLNGKQVTMLVKRVHSGIHEVDLMIMSSDRGQTSIIDILIHTCSNALSSNSDNESVSSVQKFAYTQGHKIFANSTVFQRFQQNRVCIVNVIDPHHIFVHLVTHAESLKKMNASLKRIYKNSKKNSCLPVEGTYVIVEYKDTIRGHWHRGLIKTVDMSTEKCHVLLVDWGLNITVPWSSVRMIQEEFTKLESQAILIKLAQIEPLDKGVWLESAITFLQKYYRSQETLRMIVEITDPLEVALFEMVGDVDICINATLVAENLAESTGKISETLEWPRSDAEIKGFTDDDGLVATLLKQVDAAADDESDDEEDKNIIRQKIEVVEFKSPDLIFIKFSKNEPTEMQLAKELQIHYSKERKPKEAWEPNELCVVLYGLSYARAKIIEKVEGNKYKVNVYDKGTETVLPLAKIFESVKYFNKFPNVVFKSHLADIRPAGGDKWSLSSIEALERMFDKYKDIYGTRVEGDISGKSIPMHMWYAQVKMGGALEASKTRFVSLNNLLVKLGFAYKVTLDKSESISSAKSTRSKSPDSIKSESLSSPLLSVLEKLACKSASTLVDSSTEQDSVSDAKEISDMKEGDESSTSKSTLDDSLSPTRIDKALSKLPEKIDWNLLIEEEERKRKKKRDEKDSPYRKQEAEIVDWIPPFPIKEREFHAWITCAENEGILYLREERLQGVYKDMEKNIKEYFDKNTPTSTNHKWEPGQLCTIHYKDYYYRGKVYKVNDPDDITVVMIDFGSDHKLSEKDLNREILYPKIPAFAAKIKLGRVYPKSGAWLDSDYETLLETVSEYSKIVIIGPLDDEVPLAEVFTDKGVNVNQTLVRLCPNLTRIPPSEEAGSDDDGVVIEEEAIIEADEELVVEIECGEGDSVKDPVDTTKFKYDVLPLPDKGHEETIAVSVMFVVEYNKVALKETSTITDEFFQLGDEMQKAIQYQPVIENLEMGMPCVCPFSEDGTWYRAQIYNMDGIDCGYVFVFFVDFGNVESVAVTDIKMMRPEWFKFPVSCHIAEINIEIVSDKNVQHVTQHMKKLYGKNKLAKIVSKAPLQVSLHEPDGELYYESLLSKRLVKLK